MRMFQMLKRKAIYLKPNIEIPFRGELCTIIHNDTERGIIKKIDNEIYVFGKKEHFKRRLIDWLKKEAFLEISKQSRFYSKKIDKKINRISIKDTSSQWGSCSGRNNLSFSWRLILAPQEALNYVVAHEVCHLEHMNHSKDFWSLLEIIMPDYPKYRYWLKKQGLSLMLYQ